MMAIPVLGLCHWAAVVPLVLVILASLSHAIDSGEFREIFDEAARDVPPDHRYNIKLFGAVGDGLHNDTDAILAALRAAQQTVNYSSILVPEGRYLMWPVHLESCRNMYIEVEGSLVAPQEPLDWPQSEYYIQFADPSNCSVVGIGPDALIDGNGMAWWEQADWEEGKSPSLIVFTGEMESYPQPGVYNISLRNAPYAHILATNTRMYSGPQVSGVRILATDRFQSAGILALNSSIFMENVDVDVGGMNALVQTGYGDQSSGVFRIYQATFRRGSGFTVQMTDGLMGNISLSSMQFIETGFGIRLLGARDGSGSLVDVFFDDITMINVGSPILVDNMYCPKSHAGCTRPAKGVLMSSVMFYRLTATQTSGSAGVFYCMASKPCELGLSDVDIRPASPGTENQFHCTNAVGYQEESVSPPCCLKKPSSRHRRGIDADSREFISDIPIRPQNGVEKESR